MNVHRIETILTQDGTLKIDNLPFHSGDVVEVIVLERSKATTGQPSFPLRGKLLRYDDPFGPATPSEDWDALR